MRPSPCRSPAHHGHNHHHRHHHRHHLHHQLGSAPTFPFLKYDAYTDLNLFYLSTTIMGPRNASYKSNVEYVQIILALTRKWRCRTITCSRRFGGRKGIEFCTRSDFPAGLRGLQKVSLGQLSSLKGLHQHYRRCRPKENRSEVR